MPAAIGVAIGLGLLGVAGIGAAFAWIVLALLIKTDELIEGSGDSA
jgi:uncharacterized membrane protein YhiD involved in acid resistance